jgi:hypothetical protein
MGYYVDTAQVNFRLRKENYQKAYEAMCALNADNSIKSGGSYSSGTGFERKWFSWMPENYPEVCEDAIAIIQELGFEVIEDQDGINSLYYSNKIGDEAKFFSAIAPFVEEGSTIFWRGEDGDMWAWKFDGKKMTQHGVILQLLD